MPGWNVSGDIGPDEFYRGKLGWGGSLGKNDMTFGVLADTYDGWRDDSGYKQGFEAVRIASQILGGAAPAGIGIHAPERGKFAVNLERARMLGLEQRIADSDLIEERIDRALALVEYPANPR